MNQLLARSLHTFDVDADADSQKNETKKLDNSTDKKEKRRQTFV
jgi:hypothetical protein